MGKMIFERRIKEARYSIPTVPGFLFLWWRGWNGEGQRGRSSRRTADGRPGHQGLLSSLETAWKIVPKETSREHSRYLIRSEGSQDRGLGPGVTQAPRDLGFGGECHGS